MEEFWSSIAPALFAVFGFVGWKGALFMIGGMWFGDFAGRRYPNAWQWLRAGVKKAGDTVRG
jgi:hypothetical protein